MIRLCIIASYFYPDKSVAANRINSFAKYLSARGILVDIYVRKRSKPPRWVNENIKIIEVDTFELPIVSFDKSTGIGHVIRVLYKIISNRINLVLKLWPRKVAIQIINSDIKYDFIMGSFSSEESIYCCMLVTDVIKTTPILDFRDEFLDNLELSIKTKNHRRYLINNLKKKNPIVITVSLPLKQQLEKYFSNVFEIRNGFDFDMIRPMVKHSKILKIGYFGSFYGGINPILFFEALNELVLSSDIDEKYISLEFYGTKKVFPVPGSFCKICTYYPHLEYNDAIDKMRTMNLLLLIIPTTQRKGVYSGKLFDYIGSGRKILGLLDPKDVASELIERKNLGWTVESSDKAGLKELLHYLYSMHMAGERFDNNDSDLESFHRKNQVEKLCNLMISD